MIKKIKSDIATSIKNRKINIFLLFLVLAFVILLFTKLSKEYTNTLAFKIDKINIPKENVVISDSTSTLFLTLKTHGFKWLHYYFAKPKITIDFSKDVRKNESVFIWSKDKAFLLESKQLGNQVHLLNIAPDTLFFKYDVNLVKKIPVILDANIKFSPGFDVLKDFELVPDSIEVIGPKAIASQLKNVKTNPIVLENIKSNVSKEVSLNLPKDINDIKFSNTSVVLNVKVEKFTEGTLKIPLTINNIPEGVKLKYFPKEVGVSFYTSLSNFNTIKTKDFTVECDFSKLNTDQNYLIPELVKTSRDVKRAKIKQQRIEFIIAE